MEQWIEFGKQFGFMGLVVAALGIFLYLKVWPLLTKQIDDAKAERKEEIKIFTDTIRQYNVLMAESQRDHLKALGTLAEEMRGLKEAVRSSR